MKIISLSISLLIFPLIIQGQDSSDSWFYFEKEDTLTVVAKSGLNLRDSSSADSKKIAVIPFGDKVIAKGPYEGIDEFGNRKGSWLKVRYESTEGYIFSGFITKLKIPDFDLEKLECHNLVWFDDLIRANVDTLVCSGEKVYKGFDLDGKDWKKSIWEMYRNETEIYQSFGYESKDLIIESTEINMNDVLNLLEFYVDKLKKKCPDAYYMNAGKKLRIDIKKDNEGFIKTIKCLDLNLIAERSIHKTIIRLNIWDL